MQIFLCFILLLLAQPACAEWIKPSTITEEDWKSIQSYLLPYEHPLRKKLDIIFSKGRVVSDKKTLSMNHFYFPSWEGGNRIIVAKHVGIRDYLFKIFLDSQKIPNEWNHFIKRIEGSRAIDNKITLKGFEKSFKAPKKWLYLLPNTPLQKNGVLFVLVVENVFLKSYLANQKEWKSASLKDSFLKELYTIISELGLIDSVYIDNIPFCRDGKVAFVDTEHYNLSPVPFEKLAQYLHPTKRDTWTKLYSQ